MQLKSQYSLGFALLEVLFALGLLGAGMLAVAALMQTGLQTQRQQLARETAMRLGQDLAQRMQLNASQRAAYSQSFSQPVSASPIDCQQSPCSAHALAQWDVSQWRAQVQNELPNGDAAVFASNNDWWGIVLAWSDPRETHRIDTGWGTPTCPPNKSCWRLWLHLDSQA